MATPSAPTREQLEAQVRLYQQQLANPQPYGAAMTAAPQFGSPIPNQFSAVEYSRQLIKNMIEKNSAGNCVTRTTATDAACEPLINKELVIKTVRMEWIGTMDDFERDEAKCKFKADPVPMHATTDRLIPLETTLRYYRNPMPVALGLDIGGTFVNRQLIGARAVTHAAVLEPFTNVPCTVDQTLYQRSQRNVIKTELLCNWDAYDKEAIDATIRSKDEHCWVVANNSPIVQVAYSHQKELRLNPHVINPIRGIGTVISAAVAARCYETAIATVKSLPFHNMSDITGVISRCDGEPFTSEKNVVDSSPAGAYKQAHNRDTLFTVSATMELVSACWKQHSTIVKPTRPSNE